MSDLIFYTNGEETSRIPFPTPGTKCPETKLEIKMTKPTDEQIDELWDEIGGYYNLYPEVRNTIREALNRWGNVEIEKTDDTYSVLMKIKDAYPSQKSPAEEAYKEIYGNYPMGEPFWIVFKKGYEAAEKSKVEPSFINCVLEGNPPNGYSYWNEWFRELGSKGILHNLKISSKEFNEKVKEPTKSMDEVVERLVKEHQAQKLFNRLYDELGYDFDTCEWIVNLVEDWLPKEQSAAGSQNLNTELLVEGFNDCVRKMKEMLR